MDEIKELTQLINKFRDDRNWRQFHNAKDLAISINLEASELLEHFQWKSSEESVDGDLAGISEELADVIIYSIMLCDDLNLNIKSLVQEKLRVNAVKYPVEKSKDSKSKYDKL